MGSQNDIRDWERIEIDKRKIERIKERGEAREGQKRRKK